MAGNRIAWRCCPCGTAETWPSYTGIILGVKPGFIGGSLQCSAFVAGTPSGGLPAVRWLTAGWPLDPTGAF